MATNSQIAFNPQGNTVAVVADSTAPAGVQSPVYSRFEGQESGQYRVVNAGNYTVHIGVGSTAAIAQNNAVAASSGVPAAGIPLVSGGVEILRFPVGSYVSGYAGTASTFYITPGKGL